MRVAVLMGGLSKEREISLRSGKAVAQALRAKGHDVVEIDSGRDLAARVSAAKVDAAFLVLHGRYGEDGVAQGALELLGIPYTGSGPLASGICMDKDLTKRLLALSRITLAPWKILHRDEIKTHNESPLPLPVVVKPNQEGSTIGISIVREKTVWHRALEEAARLDETILVEEFIEGTEVTVGVLENWPEKGSVRSLPVLEVVPKSGFYDFTSKYTKGLTEYIVPARIPEGVARRLQGQSEDIFQKLKLSGFARMDFIVRDGEGYFLEVNTLPGMTETSLVPKAAAAVGLSFEDLCDHLLRQASLKV